MRGVWCGGLIVYFNGEEFLETVASVYSGFQV